MCPQTIICRRSLTESNEIKNKNIPPILKKIYLQRGIKNTKELEWKTKNLISHHQLLNINKATYILKNAIFKRKKIVVIGDFDVDGACGTAISVLSLTRLGAKNVEFIIPNRFKDGYGLSPRIVKIAEKKKKSEIIITVDNGISSFNGINLARQKGMKVIVTDHHLPNDTLPEAHAIINPNLKSCKFGSKFLSGSGVAFYLMLALRDFLIKHDWFKVNKIKIPKLAEFLDLVALGTIADLAPLDLNNRILVYQGITRIRCGTCRIGIRVLIDILNLNMSKLSTEDISFHLSPIINVAGRLKNMSIGVSLLLSESIHQAFFIAKKLNFLNKKRKIISRFMEKQAFNLCKNEKKSISFILYNKNWHEGFLGIIAARIQEYFYRPTIAFTQIKNNLLKGSVRSIKEINIRDILDELNKLHPKLIVSFGGHKAAAGLIIHNYKLNEFRIFFSKLVKSKLKNPFLKKVIWSDGELNSNECIVETATLFLSSAPWGNQFSYPVFDGKFRILKQLLIGKCHLKLKIQSISGGPILNGIYFNCDVEKWPNNQVEIILITYKLNIYRTIYKPILQLIITYLLPLKFIKK